MSFYFNQVISAGFDTAVRMVSEALQQEGFGILTEIDVSATLKKKLDVNFRKYKIIGACNPSFAHKALQIEDKVGLLLPCNIIIQETVDGRTEVAAINPTQAMKVTGNDHLIPVAEAVSVLLKRVIASLEENHNSK